MGEPASEKVILSGDKNNYFNASYIDLHLKKIINCIGGGPADIQEAYSWGTHASMLTSFIEPGHYDVFLSKDELERVYTWIDINGPYYPEYESAYPNNHAGRSPLKDEEIKRIEELSGILFKDLAGFTRKLGPQISFERPHLSPLLKNVKSEEDRQEIIRILDIGMKRLLETPRADMEGFIPCPEHQNKLRNYEQVRAKQVEILSMIASGKKVYDGD